MALAAKCRTSSSESSFNRTRLGLITSLRSVVPFGSPFNSGIKSVVSKLGVKKRVTLMSFRYVETNIGNWIAFQFVYERDNVRRDHIYRDNIGQTLKGQKRKN